MSDQQVATNAEALEPAISASDLLLSRQHHLATRLDGDLKTTSGWLLTAFLLGWAGLLIRLFLSNHANHITGTKEAFLSVGIQTSTAFLWTLAWVAGGFLFGFVFGIPKVITATTSTTNPALDTPPQKPEPKLKVNTNLEDISDWLTKVLVGATLTQITQIPPAIARAAYFMALGETTSQPSFNGAIIIYYNALGFLSGYILTRMFFARAFALAD